MVQRPLIPLLGAFVGGILTGHVVCFHTPGPGLWLTSAVAITLVCFFFIPPRLRFPYFLLLFFMVGLLLDFFKDRDLSIPTLPGRRETVTIGGTVLEPPKIYRKTAKLLVRGDTLRYRGRTTALHATILVTVYNHVKDFLPGDEILFPARLRPFRNFNNPGRYDYESSMRVKGLSFGASVSDGRRIVRIGRGKLEFPLNVVERARRPLRQFFRERLSYENQALYRALILGEKQDIHSGLREPFIISGLGHVLAVSGLHIGLIACLFFFLSKRLLSFSYRLALKTDVRRIAALLTCIPVVAYTCLAGFQVSSQRAMIMALAYLFSLMIGREKEIWSTMALAAILVLACNPHALFTLSFQLSFGAVIGILWLTPLVYEKIAVDRVIERARRLRMDRILTYFLGMIAVTVVTLVFLLPITSYYFHRISLVSIPANLTVVPLLGLWVIPLGLITALCLPVSSLAAGFFLQAGTWGLEWMRKLIVFWAHYPWSEIWVITPNLLEMSLFYGFLLSLFLMKFYRMARVALLVLSLMIAGDIGYWIFQTRFHRDLKITYLDVGQGNAALIQFPGRERMLIDGGGFSRDTFDVGKMVVAPFLLHSKIRRIDYLVMSHPQSDHMNGLRFIASHFHPRELWINGDEVGTHSFVELMGIVEDGGIKKIYPRDLAGGREVGGVKIELLHPPPGRSSITKPEGKINLNDNSLVLKLQYQGLSCLFPGDIEGPGEEAVLARAGSRLRSDVLLAPHHGSKSSCTKAFLDAVQPRLCVISCGKENYFGFPHQEILQRLRRIGSDIMRVDEVGAIGLSLGHEGFRARGFLEEMPRSAKGLP